MTQRKIQVGENKATNYLSSREHYVWNLRVSHFTSRDISGWYRRCNGILRSFL